MIKKLKENFLILLISNLVTVALGCCVKIGAASFFYMV